MPKLILKFSLPEEQYEADQAVNGYKWRELVMTLDEHLRTVTKHAPDDTPDEVIEALMQVRSFIHQDMEVKGLTFD